MQQKEEKIAGHTAKHIAGHTAEHTTERNAEYNDEITTSLQENAARFQKIFSGCADIKMRTMKIGQKQQIACMAAYIEVTGGGAIFEKSLVGRLLNELCHYNEKKSMSGCHRMPLAYRMLRPLILFRMQQQVF